MQINVLFLITLLYVLPSVPFVLIVILLDVTLSIESTSDLKPKFHINVSPTFMFSDGCAST